MMNHSSFPHQVEDSPAPRVGVVVPVYNRRTTLCETMHHVVAQTLAPELVVVVDDGSTDGTPDAIEKWFAEVQPPFAWRVIRRPHRNASTARNVGLAEVNDLPFVAFLDSDDHWPHDFLSRNTNVLASQPQAVAASTDRLQYVCGELVGEDDCAELMLDPVTWIFFNGGSLASCSLFRTEAVRSAGGWPEDLDMAEDCKLFIDVALSGEWLHVPGAPVAFHRGTAASRGEEGNISRRDVDCNRQWAEVYEDIYFLTLERGAGRDRARLHQALALVWGRAGKELRHAGHLQEASDCFRRAIQWSPTMLRSWRRWIMTGAHSRMVAALDSARQLS